jgi:DNA gyrase inhibitor GyrI
MDYIRKRRVNQAALWLRHSDRPILDIALASGFDSYRTFATVFKRITGLTPGMYRKADFYYSFEPVNLLEKHSYAEDRELSLQYSDIKVIKVEPVQAIAYRHTSAAKEGLEEEAFQLFYAMLEPTGCAMDKLRFFGYNLEPDPRMQPDSHEYVIFTPLTPFIRTRHPSLFETTLEGGLYAVSKTRAESPPIIIKGWNRMLEEWLPRSGFKLGPHRFLEEHLHHRGKATRLRLLMPVIRKQEQEPIVLENIPPVHMLAFRANGKDAMRMADEQMTGWLASNEVAEAYRQSLYMTYSYGISEELHAWYELAIELPEDNEAYDSVLGRYRQQPGGLYACMTTGAYGRMTGVLDHLHAWAAQNEEYRLDENREWFAKYRWTEGTDAERSTIVSCCLPVIRKGQAVS